MTDREDRDDWIAAFDAEVDRDVRRARIGDEIARVAAALHAARQRGDQAEIDRLKAWQADLMRRRRTV